MSKRQSMRLHRDNWQRRDFQRFSSLYQQAAEDALRARLDKPKPKQPEQKPDEHR